MKSLAILLLFPLAFAEKLVIPQVEAAVKQELQLYKSYTSYKGPSVSALAEASRPIAKPLNLAVKPLAAQPYWYESITHQGKAAFNTNTGYKVYRNVKDYGAKGYVLETGKRNRTDEGTLDRDGVTDDTAAIQSAISDGNRCAPNQCASSTDKPAVVYFPSGTYIVSSSILDYYNTQLIGNPNGLPVLKATAGFSGLGIIDGDQYKPGDPNGVLGFGGTEVLRRK